MVNDATQPSPRTLEAEVRRLWAARRLPPNGGVVGRGDGPLVRQLEGSFAPTDPPELVAHRAVAADVDARYLALSGRGAFGTLRRVDPVGATPLDGVGPVLAALGVWTGGAGERPWDDADRRAVLQSITGRLAHRGILAVRDGPIRLCLSCRTPRTPERIVYQTEIGDTFLVRFPIADTDPPAEALVWVDAPWRLLGASALLVHPDVPYVVVDFRRRGASVTLLVSKGSLDRLRAWLPDVELTVREERPGREWVGKAYTYPLRHEFPIGGSLDPPAGTIQSDPDVGDTGTGIVPLVPGHGPTDADIADRLGIAGWPLLTPRGLLDPSLMHKYAGLDLETANEFVARDLTDGGAVLARLRVVRGVPYCAVCGHGIVWAPGRAWCLEPGNLPPEQRERYARLLPKDRPIGQIEISRWPVSETTTTVGPDAVTLLECSRCERLEAPDGPRECPCGGTRRPVGRRLLIAIAGAFGAWGRNEGTPPTDSIRIYANDRRRVPALVHNLTAMAGVDATTSDFALTLLPTVARVDLAALLVEHGADAVRTAFVRTSLDDRGVGTFAERCAQEAQRLARLYADASAVVARCDAGLVREGAQPPDLGARDLEAEDRAVLARWGRTHLQVFAALDRWDAGAAHRRLFRFLERDLSRYLRYVGPRLDAAAPPPTRRAALRTLLYLYRAAAIALAPIAPFTAEAIHRKYVREPRSLFEGIDVQADRSLADEAVATAWDRWVAVAEAADGYRRAHGLAAAARLEGIVATVSDEDVAEKLRAERTTIERLARVGRFEVASPKVPWSERRREVRPVEREIQRAYPSLATQIVHLLERLPPRKTDDLGTKELTVFVNGVPRTITPEMIATFDTIPPEYVPTPFALGELYVRKAPGESGGAAPPPLSPDAFWLVRRLAQRRRDPASATARRAIVVAVDPLAAELREKAPAIAAYLRIEALDVVEQVEATPPPDRLTGRTRNGARWWAEFPGAGSRGRALKHRPARSDGRRVRAPTDAAARGEVDYADEKVIQETQAIRSLGQELDGLFGVPLLGPAKVAIAWQAGLQSRAQFEAAPFDQVAALPGFGRPVAAMLWEKTGRAPPATPPRPPRSVPTNGGGGARPRRVAPDAGAERPPEAATAAAGGPVVVESAPPSSSTEEPIPAPPDLPSELHFPEAPEPVPSGPPEGLDAGDGAASTPPTPEPPPGSEEATSVALSASAELMPVPTEPIEAIEPTPAPAVAVETVDHPPAAPEPELTPAPPEPLPSTDVAPPVEVVDANEVPATEEAAVAPVTLTAPEPGPTEPAVEVASAPEPEERMSPDTGDHPAISEIPPQSEPAKSPDVSTGVEPVAAELATPEPPAPAPEAIEPPVVPELSAAPAESPVGPDTARGVESVDTEPAGEPAVTAAEVPAQLAAAEAVEESAATESAEEFGPPPVAESPMPAGAPDTPMEVLPAGESIPAVVETPSSGDGATEPPVVEAVPPTPEPPTPEPVDLPADSLSPESPTTGSPPTEVGIDAATEPTEAPEVPLAAEPPSGPASESPPDEPAAASLPGAPDSGVETPVPAPVEAVPPESPAVPIGEPPASPVPVEAPIPIAPESASIVSSPTVPTPEAPVLAPSPPTAPTPVAPPAPPPPPCGLEIGSDPTLFGALQPFLDATAAGHRGLAIVRELPERIRVHVGPRPVEVLWLSNLERTRTLRPSDLDEIGRRILRAYDEEGVTVVFFEGIEYLVRIHGIERVVAFLADADAAARVRLARIWLHLTPGLLPPSDLARIVAVPGSGPPPA